MTETYTIKQIQNAFDAAHGIGSVNYKRDVIAELQRPAFVPKPGQAFIDEQGNGYQIDIATEDDLKSDDYQWKYCRPLTPEEMGIVKFRKLSSTTPAQNERIKGYNEATDEHNKKLGFTDE